MNFYEFASGSPFLTFFILWMVLHLLGNCWIAMCKCLGGGYKKVNKNKDSK